MVTMAARSIEKHMRLLRRNSEMSLYIGFLDRVLETAGTGLMTMDNDMRIWKINRQGKEILKAGEVDGQPLSVVRGLELDLDDIARNPEKWKDKEASLPGDVHFYYTVQPVLSEHQEKLGAVMVFEEFSTVRKRAARISGAEPFFMFDHLIGSSPLFAEAVKLARKAAKTASTVLLLGETGTGKELFAQAIHNGSPRRLQPFVPINCGAIPGELLESELFGFTRGAFTGAVKEKKGLFQEAHGSTILLDEIGDIAVPLQTKLLRVLQEKQIQPLGQNKTIGVNVRVVASTNQDLEQKMATGEFREDLFYRLNVVTITMPNLAQMQEDVPLLIHHFFDHYRQRYNKKNLHFSPETLHHLYRRAWPGNVRELRHTIKRVVLLSGPERIERGDLGEPGIDLHHREHPADDTALHLQPYNEAKKAVVNRFTGTYITRLLERYHGNVSHAAAASGMQRQGLQRLMREHGIKSESFKKKSRSPR